MPIGSNGHSRKRKWQTWVIPQNLRHVSCFSLLRLPCRNWDIRHQAPCRTDRLVTYAHISCSPSKAANRRLPSPGYAPCPSWAPAASSPPVRGEFTAGDERTSTRRPQNGKCRNAEAAIGHYIGIYRHVRGLDPPEGASALCKAALRKTSLAPCTKRKNCVSFTLATQKVSRYQQP